MNPKNEPKITVDGPVSPPTDEIGRRPEMRWILPTTLVIVPDDTGVGKERLRRP